MCVCITYNAIWDSFLSISFLKIKFHFPLPPNDIMNLKIHILVKRILTYSLWRLYLLFFLILSLVTSCYEELELFLWGKFFLNWILKLFYLLKLFFFWPWFLMMLVLILLCKNSLLKLCLRWVLKLAITFMVLKYIFLLLLFWELLWELLSTNPPPPYK